MSSPVGGSRSCWSYCWGSNDDDDERKPLNEPPSSTQSHTKPPPSLAFREELSRPQNEQPSYNRQIAPPLSTAASTSDVEVSDKNQSNIDPSLFSSLEREDTTTIEEAASTAIQPPPEVSEQANTNNSSARSKDPVDVTTPTKRSKRANATSPRQTSVRFFVATTPDSKTGTRSSENTSGDNKAEPVDMWKY